MSRRSLDEYVQAGIQARYRENQELARQLLAVRAELRRVEAERAAFEQRLKLFEGLEEVKLEPPRWAAPPKRTADHVGIPTLFLTDTHFDEVVDPAQVDGVNAYDRRIAELRLRRAFEGAVKLSRDYLSGVRYEGIFLLLGGDIFSGLIHEELRETNEATIFESIVHWLEHLEAGIRLLQEHFGRVHVVAVVGNHGRRTKRPRHKFRAQDNFDWLVYKLIQRDLHGKDGITVQVSDASDAHYEIYGVRYLLTHGDQFRGGTGISAALAPLLLGAHRKTRRQAAAGRPYDIMVMGHWHQTLYLPAKGLIVGGSLKGFDEFAYNQNLEPEPPQQAFWVTTPEHGVTFTAPVFVADRRAEGW